MAPFAIDTKKKTVYYPSVKRACHSYSLLYPVPSIHTDYRKIPNMIKDWSDLTEDVAAAHTLESFCSCLPISSPSE